MFISNSTPQNQTFGIKTQVSSMIKLNHQNSKAAEAGNDILQKLAPEAKNIQVKIQEVLPNDVLGCRLFPADNLVGRIGPKAANVTPDERRLVDYGDHIKIPITHLLDEQKRADFEKKLQGFNALINKLTEQK